VSGGYREPSRVCSCAAWARGHCLCVHTLSVCARAAGGCAHCLCAYTAPAFPCAARTPPVPHTTLCRRVHALSLCTTLPACACTPCVHTLPVRAYTARVYMHSCLCTALRCPHTSCPAYGTLPSCARTTYVHYTAGSCMRGLRACTACRRMHCRCVPTLPVWACTAYVCSLCLCGRAVRGG
jgi:hypothetical protein